MLGNGSFPVYTPESGRGWVVDAIYGGTLARWRVSRTLRKMEKHPEASGQSDVGVQNLLYALTISLRPRRVLEIGTHIGTVSVVVGHALKSNRYGKLLTLEPAVHYQKLALDHLKAARLTDQVEVIPHFSFDESCRNRLIKEAPFELIFIDGAHDYEAFSHDIALAADLLYDNGIIVCHDVGGLSAELDPSGRGGVRQALWDFKEANPKFKTIFLEFPLWLNNTGTALICKERLAPSPQFSAAQTTAAEEHQTVAGDAA